MSEYKAEVLADSVSPDGVRLTTLQVCFPRFILAEFNTHRMLSRNFRSSRAVPTERLISEVEDSPFVPEAFAANKRGMQAGEQLSEAAAASARMAWLYGASKAVETAKALAASNAHKQWASRPLEPYLWVHGVVSATDWKNFFALRCHPDAQPEFNRIACMMRDAMIVSVPTPCTQGQWHLPYIQPEDYNRMSWSTDMCKISAARCARVSYVPWDTGKRDLDADMKTFDRLAGSVPIHASPLEHQATPHPEGSGNFRGWKQYRHTFTGESVKG